MKIYITKSDEETQELGRKIAQSIKPGIVVCLYGDLGSGKTTFSKGFAKGLSIKKRIISPTFTIVRTYRIRNHESPVSTSEAGRAGIMNFYHIDLYRVKDEKELVGLGLEEIFEDEIGRASCRERV